MSSRGKGMNYLLLYFGESGVHTYTLTHKGVEKKLRDLAREGASLPRFLTLEELSDKREHPAYAYALIQIGTRGVIQPRAQEMVTKWTIDP